MRSNHDIGTIETCEGTVCGRCKVSVDLCACRPDRRLAYRSMAERITGQGLLPQTETREAA